VGVATETTNYDERYSKRCTHPDSRLHESACPNPLVHVELGFETVVATIGASDSQDEVANQEMLNRAKVIRDLQALCFVSFACSARDSVDSKRLRMHIYKSSTHYVQLCCRAIHTRDLNRLLCTSMGMHMSLMTVNGKDLLNLSTCRRVREQDGTGRISAVIL
jgi:hypothetical protein